MKSSNIIRYSIKLRQLLLGAGQRGMSQWELNQRTRTKVFSTNDMLAILVEWENKRWVESFRITVLGAKRPTTIWRASTLLRDEWANDFKLINPSPVSSNKDQDASQYQSADLVSKFRPFEVPE